MPVRSMRAESLTLGGRLGRRLSIGLMLLLGAAPAARADVNTIATPNRSTYRLVAAELDGNPAAREVVGGAYSGHVTAYSNAGAVLWRLPRAGSSSLWRRET
ncbi:hypothetical protein HS125_18925 [bacterium]|nr:hypothetical protein [bacterium]